MHYYRLDLLYDGRTYQGWQTQPHQQTVQDTFDQALASLGLGPSIAAGRTDAGVHALQQVVRTTSLQAWDGRDLVRALNAHLPSSIRVEKASAVGENFHPLKNAGKEYRYFWAAQVAPFCQGLITQYDFVLDLNLMRQAAQDLVGKHDFAPFACRGTPVKSTIREIFAVRLTEHVAETRCDLPWKGGTYCEFSIIGSGFLKQMVRLIMGGLMNVGRGKVSLDQWQTVLAGNYAGLGETNLAQEASPSSPASWPFPRLGPVAPADGLYLARAFFSPQERAARIAELQSGDGNGPSCGG